MPNLLRRFFPSTAPKTLTAPLAIEPRFVPNFERLHGRALDCFADAQIAHTQGRWEESQALYKKAMRLDLTASCQAPDALTRSSLTCYAAVWAMKGGLISRAQELATQSLDGASRDTRAHALEMLEMLDLMAISAGDPSPTSPRHEKISVPTRFKR